MTQLDVLLAKMAEKKVERALFANDQPGVLVRGTNRVAGPTLSGDRLAQLVQEVLPSHLQAQMNQEGSFQFLHLSAAGTVTIAVQRAGDAMRVSIALPTATDSVASNVPLQPAPQPVKKVAPLGACLRCGTPNDYSAMTCVSCKNALPWSSALDGSNTTTSASEARSAQPFALESLQPILATTLRVEHRVGAVAFSPDGTLIASGSFDRKIRVWDLASGQVRRELNHGGNPVLPGGVASLSFSPDGRALASGSGSHMKLWNLLTGKERWEKKSLGSYRCVACSPDNKCVANGTFGGPVNVWDINDGKPLHHLKKIFGLELGTESGIHSSSQAMNSIAFAPDGKTLVSARNRELKLLKSPSTELVKEAGEHSAGILGAAASVAFSPDGKTLASGYQSTGNSKVTLWDAQTLQQRAVNTEGNGVLSVAFSPDSNVLATGSMDGGVRLYEVSSGRLLRSLIPHEGYVQSVVFSKDGQFLASGSYDSTVRIWRLTGSG